jgi:hypothetical protein
MLHKKILIMVLICLTLIGLMLFFIGKAYASNVTDSNRGNSGYILVNNGGAGHSGTWIDPNSLPAIIGLNKALDTEVNKRVSADEELMDSIKNEYLRAVDVEKNLQESIDIESMTREMIDSQLQDNINVVSTALHVESNNRALADEELTDSILSEISRAVGVEGILQENIDKEIESREIADGELQNNINIVDNNSQNRDTTLQTNINNEANTRGVADTQLQNNINSESTNRIIGDNKLQNDINTVNNRVDNVEHRVKKLEKTQYVIHGELKFVREKHLEVGIYTEYNVGRSVCSEVGINIIIPIGESYLDRENKKINSRLTALENKGGIATVIERTVDTKGKVKSISITEGTLLVNGEF